VSVARVIWLLGESGSYDAAVPESVVLLHGFSATHRSWDGVSRLLDRERYLPLALDLPGHGAAAACERPITFARCVQHALARAPERFELCGYSLGGRIALGVALAAPERVQRLLLVSSTAGIEDPAERQARRRHDAGLARELESAPLEQFIERWQAQPLFAGDPPEVSELARADQRRNRPDALAAVLRGVGTGEMEPLWSSLKTLAMPATVLVGDRDEKFSALGRRLAQALPHGRLVIAAGGHRLALESPAAVAGALERPDA
jgi:2-succinyl-6-hydroxy-2,4-cyclohexadiene-1-carboxylate synthase